MSCDIKAACAKLEMKSKVSLETLCVRLLHRVSKLNKGQPAGAAQIRFRSLGARLEYPSEIKVVGSGDDGLVFTVDNSVAVKVYRRFEGGDQLDKVCNEIRQDQAYREFKALSLIGPHPNFARLISTELDICDVKISDNSIVGAWAIRTEYLQGAVAIDTSFRLWGLSGKASAQIYDLRLRDDTYRYICGQVLSAVHAMRSMEIEHRDLDTSNIVVQPHTLRVVILDFARSRLPSNDLFEETEDPLKLIAKAQQACEGYGDCSNTKISELEKEYELYRKLYRSPMEGYFNGSEPTDEQAAFRSLLWGFDVAELRFGTFRRYGYNDSNAPSAVSQAAQNILSWFHGLQTMSVDDQQSACSLVTFTVDIMRDAYIQLLDSGFKWETAKRLSVTKVIDTANNEYQYKP